ncbi:hypothetical protein BZG36_00989 [Bifiguratus adelaidae]|uniref:Uncharacterized protein n=1 Tax=Bifiguratus adelaidae TaxID=1938954 RepID=A0A261Y6A1_9FUNG|nr:hypothetical protein BZG36_00989 [Bifiguratus adelaidae]
MVQEVNHTPENVRDQETIDTMRELYDYQLALGYNTLIQSNDQGLITSSFWAHPQAIQRSRKLWEVLLVDVPNPPSSYGWFNVYILTVANMGNQYLQTILLAGAWMKSENAQNYESLLKPLSDTVYKPAGRIP